MPILTFHPQLLLSLFLITSTLSAKTTMSMPLTSELSPDGKTIAFSWNNDIWTVPVSGGKAERITTHPAFDFRPLFTPDGKSIFFNSNREGATQIYKKNLQGGVPEQINLHTQTTLLEDISSDGKTLLTKNYRGFAGRNPARLYTIDLEKPTDEALVFDSPVTNGRISPDKNRILFSTDGVETYRKGYVGSQSSKIWIYDIKSKSFTQPIDSTSATRWPRWNKTDNSFYYVSDEDGVFNLYRKNVKANTSDQLTFFKEDGVILPCISDDGSTIVFRRLFHLYSLKTKKGSKPKKLDIYHEEIDHAESTREVTLSTTTDIDFSESGLEIALVAGNNIYAMDTILKEPIELTKSSEHKSNIYFGKDNKSILYIQDDGIDTAICKVTKEDNSKFWWEKQDLITETIYQSHPTLKGFTLSPNKEKLAINTDDGRLVVTDTEGNYPRLIAQSWNVGYASWSPDSEWLTYSESNDQFNSDIFIAKADGTVPPVNISRHPDNEFNPIWSPDEAKIAFIGKRVSGNYDLFVVDLLKDEVSKRETELKKAREAMKKDASYKKEEEKEKPVKETKDTKTEKSTEKEDQPTTKKEKAVPKEKPTEVKKDEKEEETSKKAEEIPKKSPSIPYSLDGIGNRIKRIEQSQSISNMLWSSDSKHLFVQYQDGKAIFKIDIESGKSDKYADASGNLLRANDKGDIYLIHKKTPTVISKGKPKTYPFKILSEVHKEERFLHTFRLAWRIMRDGFYDEKLNNLDWDNILTKYEEEATNAISSEALERIVYKMLGELNASHTGVKLENWTRPFAPKKLTQQVVHLGVEFDKAHKGKGYRIKTVYPDGPATMPFSELDTNDVLLEVNGTAIHSDTPLTDVFLLNPTKPVVLKVMDEAKEEREVTIQPISFREAATLKREAQILHNEKLVNAASDEPLGYINISQMNWDQFTKFETHLYEKGYGKKGLVIDIRDNGGGFTADHLLTILNQKRHAFTIPRNGGVGYPQDRIVYATWDKPIVVLCNQNSFSNAEIFAHAIKTLKRGKLVGAPTAGGVISTGSRSLAGFGTMRFPFRGWFDLTGQDMESKGAQPDYLIWQTPDADVKGIDLQLEKAIEVLKNEIKTAQPLHQDAIYKSTQ